MQQVVVVGGGLAGRPRRSRQRPRVWGGVQARVALEDGPPRREGGTPTVMGRTCCAQRRYRLVRRLSRPVRPRWRSLHIVCT